VQFAAQRPSEGFGGTPIEPLIWSLGLTKDGATLEAQDALNLHEVLDTLEAPLSAGRALTAHARSDRRSRARGAPGPDGGAAGAKYGPPEIIPH
jgi:hypothetical protein